MVLVLRHFLDCGVHHTCHNILRCCVRSVLDFLGALNSFQHILLAKSHFSPSSRFSSTVITVMMPYCASWSVALKDEAVPQYCQSSHSNLQRLETSAAPHHLVWGEIMWSCQTKTISLKILSLSRRPWSCGVPRCKWKHCKCNCKQYMSMAKKSPQKKP